MPLSLHAAFVPSAFQMLGTASHLLNKTEDWCAQRECDHSAILSAQLIEDMLPFTYQIKSVAEHTAGAIAAVREALNALDEAEMESWIGRDMRFEFKTSRMDFTVENFLLSFAQPNFYFHASAAYAIARHLGVEIGKMDFMGKVRVVQA